MIVVDTNILAYFYIYGDHSKLVSELFALEPNWNAPALWRSEFRSVLSQYLRKDILSLDEIMIILQQAESLMMRNEYEISSALVMQLVASSNCSAYDCEFVALAQFLDVPLITTDKKILQEFPQIAYSIDSFLSNQ